MERISSATQEQGNSTTENQRKEAETITNFLNNDKQRQPQKQQHTSKPQQQEQQPLATTPPLSPIPPPTKQRNKLKRCAAKQSSNDHGDDFSITATTISLKKTTTIAENPTTRTTQIIGEAPTEKTGALTYQEQAESGVHSLRLVAMGGSFTDLATLNLTKATKRAPETAITIATTATRENLTQMQEKLFEKDESISKEKTEKLGILKKDTNSTANAKEKLAEISPISKTAKSIKAKTTASTSTTSKFAEKLRRSFRRGEHKSLEFRKSEKVTAEVSGVSPPSVCSQLQQQLSVNNSSGTCNVLRYSQKSLHSLNSLPTLNPNSNSNCIGHINHALILDSPDEATPPEFAYQNLSSVATTNSSTSLESNITDFCEQNNTNAPTQTDCSFWTWPQQNQHHQQQQLIPHQEQIYQYRQQQQKTEQDEYSSRRPMGGGINSKIRGCRSTKSFDTTENEQQEEQVQPPPAPPRSPKFHSQSSSKSDTSPIQPNISPSCSITSENSTNRITRLHNSIFKSSNESRSSLQGHSNEGFNVSSHNSSSGEWENVGACGFSPMSSADFHAGSFFEDFESIGTSEITIMTTTATSTTETIKPEQFKTTSTVSYYQYPLTSPNNPFLPEIIAQAYQSTYEDEPEPDDNLDANITSVKYLRGMSQSQLATSDRNGSQESSHSESGITAPIGATSLTSYVSPSSTSSTPGRQRRKLFSLNSPTRHLLHQQSSHHHSQEKQLQQQKQPHHQNKATSAVSASNSVEDSTESNNKTLLTISKGASSYSGAGNTVRYLNPFLPSSTTSDSSNSTSTKRAPPKSSPIVTSSTTMLHDLDAKREEFLRATMKICLVVSPPSSKLQMKSKSLTHLDGLDSMLACSRDAANGTSTVRTNRGKNNTASSSEYFSISFYTETGEPDEEFIQATKGVTLAIAISQALRRRHLSFSQVCITDCNSSSSFLEAGGNSPLTLSLDENTDAENLAGRHLAIFERDGNRKPLQKASSFGSRTRPARLLSSVSTEETSESAVPGKHLKQRWSGLFGGKNPQHNQLCELLNNYALSGVPRLKGPDAMLRNKKIDGALNYLDGMHKSWRDFVNSNDLSENEAKIQTAIWELVTTEVYYIHALQMVTDLFVACLEALQSQSLLTEVDQHRLFANIREICNANLEFWTRHLYPMVAHSIATSQPMRIVFFEEGFKAFATIFSPYTKYCAEQSSCQFYCKDLNINNAVFASYLAWCESQKMCNRLRLADILVRPMQRLTKYSLLLAAIKKHMINFEDIEAVEAMMYCVESFVASVNNYLTQRQEMERLKGVMARIESYDVAVNTNNEFLEKMIKQYSIFFDLCAVMKNVKPVQLRRLFMEGDHKFKDHLGKVDVHCFLFTDFLLICKNVAKKGIGAVKVIRQPYFTDRLLVHQTQNVLHCVYLNEFNLAVTAFTLQCSEAKNWADAIRRAKMIYIRLKQAASNLESSHKDNTMTIATSSKTTITCSAASLMTTTTSTNAGTTSTKSPDTVTVKKSPLNSSIGSHVSSANNSRSGSVDWNDSRNISVDSEKTNSFSSDEGSASALCTLEKPKLQTKVKESPPSSKTLCVHPTNNLVQSLPNLNLHVNQHNKLYHTYSNNTLLVPGVRHARNLLSPNFHNVSYPPPSPTRTTLRRASAIPKNPPLVKTRNITSQSSINWHQIPSTPTPTSPNTSVPIVEETDKNIETLMTSPTPASRLPPYLPSECDQFKDLNLFAATSNATSNRNVKFQLQQKHNFNQSNETDV